MEVIRKLNYHMDRIQQTGNCIWGAPQVCRGPMALMLHTTHRLHWDSNIYMYINKDNEPPMLLMRVPVLSVVALLSVCDYVPVWGSVRHVVKFFG